jgi:hypothetical protein
MSFLAIRKRLSETFDESLSNLDDIRAMCTRILSEYEKIPSSQLVQASKDMMAYASAARSLCDSIELGHRDSAKEVAYRDLESLLSSMIDIKQRMERRTVKEPEHEDDRDTSPQTSPPEPPTLPPPDEELILQINETISQLQMTDDEKIGVLLGITLQYCRRAKKTLRQCVDELESSLK